MSVHSVKRKIEKTAFPAILGTRAENNRAIIKREKERILIRFDAEINLIAHNNKRLLHKIMGNRGLGNWKSKGRGSTAGQKGAVHSCEQPLTISS
jgi:hypothetical protein